ncbi:F-box protein At3g07870-like [Castanea sativa]|uniref:F-box protein At3g07870-like n=1 Tax=Castanea sativa TaxID=21020 RepID=UPI003F64B31E
MSRPMEQCLDEDLVFDILTLLPVKSLIRFRCVSHSWNSTIISRLFITTHLNLNLNRKQPKLLSNTTNNESHNGFIVWTLDNELCTFVCNSNRTLTEISRLKIPFPPKYKLVNFCNGLFCFDSFTGGNHIVSLWNPRIRKFKVVSSHHHRINPNITLGLGYDSQNNDFKILRMGCTSDIFGRQPSWPEAEIYTLSTDSWRKVLISVESIRWPIRYLYDRHCTLFNGALHTIACAADYKFILSFDVNDERFHEIMLPQNYFGGLNVLKCEQLHVFKGSLALIVFDYNNIMHYNNTIYICEMKEYGVAESWTKKYIPIGFSYFYGCTVNGELLFKNANGLVSTFDPESLNKNIFAIEAASWVGRTCTANSMESLILLDGE